MMVKDFSRVFYALIITSALLCVSTASRSDAAPDWDIGAEIVRLYREVPTLDAFDGAEGVVWHSDYSYDLLADGTMKKRHRLLLFLGNATESPGITSHTIHFPYGEGADVTIDKAACFDMRTGREISPLTMKYFDENGLRYYRADIPFEARNRILAFDYTSTNPMKYYFDEVLELAGDLPIWEQFVNVEIPSVMDFYWEGVGVRSPERHEDAGNEKIRWTILNQHVWKNDGIVNEKMPTLLFSLHRGLLNDLKNLATRVEMFKPPSPPAGLSSSKGNLQKAYKAIQEHMKGRDVVIGGLPQKAVRNDSHIPLEGPWTRSEQTLIAAKWLESLGWDVKVFWSQKIPVGVSGPSSSALWDEPVLRISQDAGKGEVYFKSDPELAFGKLPIDLYGATVYRFGSNDIERISIPRGSASENSLGQTWKLELDESGLVQGTLDLTITGGWLYILGTGGRPELGDISAELRKKISFPMPGIELEPKSLKQLSSGYRLTFDVSARSGIASGTDILLRLPGALPLCFADIPPPGEAFSFRFPFVLEQNAVITTPKGYQAFMLPAKTENGDSKAMIESSVIHWPKRRRAEANFRWTVRNVAVDETASPRILDQAKTALAWPHTNIPLRK